MKAQKAKHENNTKVNKRKSTTTMVRWNAGREGKVLASLFENRLADPGFTKAADIDRIKDLREEFKGFSPQTFRNNCKSTANNWMAAKTCTGLRRKDSDCESYSAKHAIESKHIIQLT